MYEYMRIYRSYLSARSFPLFFGYSEKGAASACCYRQSVARILYEPPLDIRTRVLYILVHYCLYSIYAKHAVAAVRKKVIFFLVRYAMREGVKAMGLNTVHLDLGTIYVQCILDLSPFVCLACLYFNVREINDPIGVKKLSLFFFFYTYRESHFTPN